MRVIAGDPSFQPPLKEVSSMPVRTEQYTLGVEEEYQIVDPETRELRAHGGSVVQRARQIVGEV
jgi:hypothetical protein